MVFNFRLNYNELMKNEVTVIHTVMMEEPIAVATVDVGPSLSGMGALEYAFRATQNSTEKWAIGPFHSNGEPNSEHNPDVTVLGEKDDDDWIRSTSVGDELLYEGRRYRVDEYGFKLVTEESITFHDENREEQIKEIAEEILKNAKK